MSDIDSSENPDVAITFLGEDEEIAKKLFEALDGRLDVFYYADRQSELVGTDGEESFGTVFRDKTRIVVILYRKGWGETMMTRAEKSGIKQRASKEGYEFSIWVPLDEEKSVPAYLDPQFIWFDFDRWGIEGLSAVIEEKVKESGRHVRPETVIDRLNKLNNKVDLKKERDEFKWSPKGVSFTREAESKIETIIREKTKKLGEISDQIRFGVDTRGSHVGVTSYPYRLVFYIYIRAINTIQDDQIVVDFLKNQSRRSSYNNFYDKVRSYKFKPTLNENKEPAWEKKNKYYSLAELVDHMLEILTDACIKEAENNL